MSDQPVVSTPEPGPLPAPRRRRPVRIILLGILGVLVLGFVGIQLIPVNRTNPAGAAPIKWDSPQTEALAQRACLDCHSNATIWPWYSYVAPASWLVYYDVVRGRNTFNFSTLAAGGGARQGFNPAAQQGDLAYQLGQFLAGGGNGPEGFGGEGGAGRQPGGFNGTRPAGGNGQAPNPQFTPQPGQQRPAGGQFPGGGITGRIGEVFQNNSMPPASYLIMHPSASLTADEKAQLLKGLQATFGTAAGGNYKD